MKKKSKTTRLQKMIELVDQFMFPNIFSHEVASNLLDRKDQLVKVLNMKKGEGET